MARKALEITIPMYRYEIGHTPRLAQSNTRFIEIGQPIGPIRTPRHGRQAYLDTMFSQWRYIAHPGTRCRVRGDIGATCAFLAVWFVVGEDVGDVGSTLDLGENGGKERGVGGGAGCAVEHWHKLECRVGCVFRGWRGLVVVVPSQIGTGADPY